LSFITDGEILHIFDKAFLAETGDEYFDYIACVSTFSFTDGELLNIDGKRG